jgi:hypothetical protein
MEESNFVIEEHNTTYGYTSKSQRAHIHTNAESVYIIITSRLAIIDQFFSSQ